VAPPAVLDVLGPDVHAGGQNDQVAGAAKQADVAGRVDRRQVAGSVPAIPQHLGRPLGIVPVAEHHVRSACQKLALRTEAHLHVLQRPADTARRRAAVARAAGDDGRALAGAVALHDPHAQPLPEALRLRRQRGAARGDEAQAAADPAVDGPEQPVAPGERQALSQRHQGSGAARAQPAPELLLQRATHPRQKLGHHHHVRDVLLREHAHDVRRAPAGHVMDGRAHGEGVEQADRELEEVRERQDARRAAGGIEPDSGLERLHLRAEVGVGDHAALGLSRRARGEGDDGELFGRRLPTIGCRVSGFACRT
jgi:hypothetical protein